MAPLLALIGVLREGCTVVLTVKSASGNRRNPREQCAGSAEAGSEALLLDDRRWASGRLGSLG